MKALFFFGDNGYPDFNRSRGRHPSPSCAAGRRLRLPRYMLDRKRAELAAAGITDAASFTSFYWGQQLSSAGTVLVLTLLGGLGGGMLYGVFRPKPISPSVARPAPG